jgi:hypothetical protein
VSGEVIFCGVPGGTQCPPLLPHTCRQGIVLLYRGSGSTKIADWAVYPGHCMEVL